MTPSDVVGSITAAIGLAKELISINKAVDEAQWKLKTAELTSALADAKIGVVELRDEITNRDAEIERLRKAFEFSGKTIRKHHMTYEMHADGGALGMPFCPRCIAADGFYIQLTALQKSGRPAQCPQCKSEYDRQTEYVER